MSGELTPPLHLGPAENWESCRHGQLHGHWHLPSLQPVPSKERTPEGGSKDSAETHGAMPRSATILISYTFSPYILVNTNKTVTPAFPFLRYSLKAWVALATEIKIWSSKIVFMVTLKLSHE